MRALHSLCLPNHMAALQQNGPAQAAAAPMYATDHCHRLSPPQPPLHATTPSGRPSVSPPTHTSPVCCTDQLPLPTAVQVGGVPPTGAADPRPRHWEGRRNCALEVASADIGCSTARGVRKASGEGAEGHNLLDDLGRGVVCAGGIGGGGRRPSGAREGRAIRGGRAFRIGARTPLREKIGVPPSAGGLRVGGRRIRGAGREPGGTPESDMERESRGVCRGDAVGEQGGDAESEGVVYSARRRQWRCSGMSQGRAAGGGRAEWPCVQGGGRAKWPCVQHRRGARTHNPLETGNPGERGRDHANHRAAPHRDAVCRGLG